MKSPPQSPRGGDSGEVLRRLHHRANTDLTAPQSNSSPPSNMSRVSARSVSWWPVHEYVAPVLARVGPYPMVGTPEWCALPDDDPRKIAAFFSAAEHRALRVELGQEVLAGASREIYRRMRTGRGSLRGSGASKTSSPKTRGSDEGPHERRGRGPRWAGSCGALAAQKSWAERS